MMMKESLFILISNVLGRGSTNDDGGISFILISNVLGRGSGAGEGAH